MSTTDTKLKDDKPYLWKWATVLAIVALLISVFFNLYDRFWSTNGPEIVAEANESRFTLPNNLPELIEAKTKEWGQDSEASKFNENAIDSVMNSL